MMVKYDMAKCIGAIIDPMGITRKELIWESITHQLSMQRLQLQL